MAMFKQFLSLFLQANCPLCQRTAENNFICRYCEQKLLSCQLDNPQQFWQGELPLFVWGKYDGYLKKAIACCKYDLHSAMGELLGELLGKKWLEFQLTKRYSNLTVMPIPLHPKKLKMRGFNQAELIAKNFCEVTGYQHLPDLLSRVKETEAMFGLSATERINNIKNAFFTGKDYSKYKRNNPILIIDDIYTTGTTVREAIQVLEKLQIKTIGVAVTAKTGI